MNDYRAAGQELQGQVLAAARKGQERVSKSVKNVTAAAQQIRPQLASLPRPTLNLSALPGHAQLREMAPAFVTKLPETMTKLPETLQSRLPGKLQSRLPSQDQLKSGAQELAGHARSVQRLVSGQVRNVATPLAQQAAARLSQVGATATKTAEQIAQPRTETTTKVDEVTVTKGTKATAKDSRTAKATGTAKTTGTARPTAASASATSAAKPSATKTTDASKDETAKPRTRPTSTADKAKPAAKAKPADKDDK